MADNSSLSFSLSGQRVVITGAGGGVGTSLVQAFHRAGSVVIACDRDDALLDALPQDQLSERHVFDMTNPDRVNTAALSIGHVDILVNNAGFTKAENFEQVDDEAVEAEINANLTGTIRLTRALLPSMVSGGGGAIVFVSSVNAKIHFGNPIYSVAKAGMLAFARGIAVEYGGRSIRANSVSPGSMLTNAWQQRIDLRPSLVDDLTRYYPMNRLVRPEELANAILFLSSPLSSGITGIDLPVDAGLTAGNFRLVNDIIGLT